MSKHKDLTKSRFKKNKHSVSNFQCECWLEWNEREFLLSMLLAALNFTYSFFLVCHYELACQGHFSIAHLADGVGNFWSQLHGEHVHTHTHPSMRWFYLLHIK